MPESQSISNNLINDLLCGIIISKQPINNIKGNKC